MKGKHMAENTAIEKATTEIENVLNKCNVMALREMKTLMQAVTLAHGVTQLRRLLSDDIMKSIFMPLQGTPLGFVTDKDKEGGYPISVVRDCLVEGMIHGLHPIGNEWNIIAGRCYAAKNGYARLVAEFPGLTDLCLVPGVPAAAGEKGALVPFRATWRLNGKTMELLRQAVKMPDGSINDTRVAVKVNAGMGADAIIGKATRKILKAIYDQITGSKLTLSEGEVLDTVGEVVSEPSPAPAPASEDGKRIRLGRNRETVREPAPAPAPAAPATHERAHEVIDPRQSNMFGGEPMREPGEEG
jgi:hypothetical protein